MKIRQLELCVTIGLSLLIGLSPETPVKCIAADALKGEVQQNDDVQGNGNAPIVPLATPVLKPDVPKTQNDETQLNGKSEEDQLDGVEKGFGDPFKGQKGKASQDNGDPLRGGTNIQNGQVSGGDPDEQDQELQVEWDRWRNRFLRAVLAGATESINNPEEVRLRWDPVHRTMMPALPMGIESWFSCKITRDRRILALRIEHSSGFETYDRAVLNAVKALEGTSILRFPENSHRQVVLQDAGIKTSDHSENRYFKFNDVERYRAPN